MPRWPEDGPWRPFSIDDRGVIRIERVTASGRLEYKYIDLKETQR